VSRAAKDEGAGKHVAVRLDAETLARVDALLPSLSKPWRRSTRSDALRALILAGLDAEARRAAAPPKAKRKK
jgi:hypothetical protein